MKTEFGCPLYVDGDFKDYRSISAWNIGEAKGKYMEELDKEGIKYEDFPDDVIVELNVV